MSCLVFFSFVCFSGRSVAGPLFDLLLCLQYTIKEGHIIAQMSHPKLKIEFHPRRFSRSGSRQKFSPYRTKHHRIQNSPVHQENKQKIDTNEPLINFRRLLDPNPTKKRLKINQDAQKMQKEGCTYPRSSHKIKESVQHQSCDNCIKLMGKIEDLTTLMHENLKQINKSIQFPRTQDRQDDLSKQLPYQQQAENQRIIIHYLDQLRNRSDQISHLQHQRNAYEQQLSLMKKTVLEWQARYKDLETKFFCNTNNSEQLSAGQFPSNKTCIDASSSSKFLFNNKSSSEFQKEFDFPKEEEEAPAPTSNNSMKVILADIVKRQGSDFQKIMGELQQIKLENQMLREEVNLLNYALEEKDSKIEKLKNELFFFIRKSDHKPSPCKSMKSSIKTSQKRKEESANMRSMGVSIQLNIQDQKNMTSTNKKTNSFIISSSSNIFLDTIFKPSMNGGDISLDQAQNIDKMTKTSPMSPQRQRGDRRSKTRVYENKLTMAKSLLKLKKQESAITKFQKQQLQKEKKELQCFSESRMQDLDLIQRTLMHRFKGFKWSFQNIQTILLQREDPYIDYTQMKEMLAEYPFSLDKRLKRSALEYILRDNDSSSLQNIQIPCDLFCNRLRQLIPDVQPLQQEQQSNLMQTLKKKIYMFQQGIQNQCSELSDTRGCIMQEYMRNILSQFKLTQLQIETIISQCCLLSSDADHLNYKHYFSIFRSDQ